MARPRNIIGPTLRKRREERGITQTALAARCSSLGWPLSRETLAKIEGQIRWVGDFELLCLAKALSLDIRYLYPEKGGQDLKRFFPPV